MVKDRNQTNKPKREKREQGITFTQEELDFIDCLLFEQITKYTSNIAELRVKKLSAKSFETFQEYEDEIDYFLDCRKVITKLKDYLK